MPTPTRPTPENRGDPRTEVNQVSLFGGDPTHARLLDRRALTNVY